MAARCIHVPAVNRWRYTYLLIVLADHLRGIETPAENRGAARMDQRCGQDVQATGVEQRGVQDPDVVLPQAPARDGVDRGAAGVLVAA